MAQIDDAHFQNSVVSCQDFYPGIRWISAKEFINLNGEREWNIVDVRSDAERAVSVIPGSISINAFRENIDVYKEQPVLAYCTIGCRSASFAQILQEQGIEVYNLWGGVIGWALQGGKFSTLTGSPTRKVHTHGKRWNLLPPEYTAVW